MVDATRNDLWIFAPLLIFILSSIQKCKANDCQDQRPSEKPYLYSKEDHFDDNHLHWGPATTSSDRHLSFHEAVPGNSRLVIYLRNVQFDPDGPQYDSSLLQALLFDGSPETYATVMYTEGENVQGEHHFTWYMDIQPDPGGSGEGVILEYSDCFSPLRVMQTNMVDILITVGDNLGNLHSLIVPGILRTSAFTSLAFSYKVDETALKVIQFEDGEEAEILLTICPVDVTRLMNATGDVRIGSSYNASLSSFKGKIGCIQYFPGYMLKSYTAVPEYCDPSLSRHQDLNFMEYTKDEDASDLIPARICPYDVITTESPTTETPTTESPTTETPTTESPTTETPTTALPTTETPTTELPTTETPTTELPTTETPTTELPTTETPTTELPTTETPTTELPTTETPTTELPTTETPTTDLPTTETPTTELPTTETPTTELPTTETPTTELPTTETPTTELPTTETPTTELPTTETPTTELPTTETAATDLPTTESTTSETSVTIESPSHSCAKYQRYVTSVKLEPSLLILPSIGSNKTRTVIGCAYLCLRNGACSAFGFGGVSCLLTTSGNLTAQVFPSAGPYDLYLMTYPC